MESMVCSMPFTPWQTFADGFLVDGSLWFYAPNKGAPVVFAVLFLVSGITHGYQCM